MAQTAGGTYYAASSELVSSWPATSLDLANQLESRFAAKVSTQPTADQTITAQSATVTPLQVKGAASQSDSILAVIKSDNTNLFSVGPDGSLSGTSVGEWTAWTPVLTGSWAIGNGTAVGRYRQIGKTVHIRGYVTIGSTTTKSGGLGILLPVNGKDAAGDSAGLVRLTDSGTNQYQALGIVFDTAMYFRVNSVSGSYISVASDVTHTVPFTWTTGDSFNFSATYEAA